VSAYAHTRPARLGGRAVLLAPALVLGLVVAALLAGAFAFSHAGLATDGAALARVDLPLAGGTVTSVRAWDTRGRPIPVSLRNGRLWPRAALAPGERVTVQAIVHRPGWIGWLAGNRDTVRLDLRTPSATLSAPYLTLRSGEPLRASFSAPVSVVAYGQGSLHRRVLLVPSSQVTLPQTSQAGTLQIAAVPRTWERLPHPSVLSWFPAGAGASAVASPSPGSRIAPDTPIYMTFSEPVSAVLGGARPGLTPATQGRWGKANSHTLVFRPSGYGYGLGTQVSVLLPSSVRLLGASATASASTTDTANATGLASTPGSAGTTGPASTTNAASTASWTVPNGSLLRAQQLLATLGYLPLRFQQAGPVVAMTAAAQESAAVSPPRGSFSWRYGNTPSSLRGLWAPGSENVVMKGALMAFEQAHELTTDGIAGPSVWHELIGAAIAGRQASGGYTYVSVSEGSQSLDLWHDGSTVLTTPVNTGIASAPTALGTFPVYEHIASGTMSGTNPDGTQYKDPGVPWISYFNGGDALHGFNRAQYGFPQSLGCVEMPVGTAGRVWPYTPIGTLVHIE
jgi:L,D-transpeptidase-like protein